MKSPGWSTGNEEAARPIIGHLCGESYGFVMHASGQPEEAEKLHNCLQTAAALPTYFIEPGDCESLGNHQSFGA